MLDPKKNRMDYGEQLIPPDSSYDLAYAVGTTYSLDLEALMVLPVALFYSRLLDCSPDDLHFDILDSITRASDKIRVYCQMGKIKVPQKYNRLMTYWEKGISQIRMPSYLSSFHPKVWVVRFTKPKVPAYYRLVVTSRNLTYTHDWDIALATEGSVGEKIIDKNNPIIGFLKYLEGQAGTSLPVEFLNDLQKVDFNLPDGFRLMNFHPIGFKDIESGLLYRNPFEARAWDDLLVISPFVDAKSIKHLKEKTENIPTVLSRKEELDRLDISFRKKEIGEENFYQLSEFIRTAESIEGINDGNQLEVELQNLHAKTYIGTKGNYYYWFMGSANCSQPAFGRNVEFMVELKTDQSALSPIKIKKLLTEPKQGELPLFEAYKINGRNEALENNDVESQLRKVIYDVTCIRFEGIAEKRSEGSEGLFDLLIVCYAEKLFLPPGFEIKVRPLPEADNRAMVIEPGKENQYDDFKGYSEIQLSPFLEVTVYYRDHLLKAFIIDMEISLPDSRMDLIFKSFVDNREKFLKYLSFLLSGTTPEPLRETGDPHHAAPKDRIGDGSQSYGALYENLLVAASRRPERLRSLEKIIERLKGQEQEGTSVLTTEFLRLWNVFLENLNKATE